MASILIISGSVYGGAQFAAEQVQTLLQHNGHQATMTDDPSVDDIKSTDNDTLLVVTSTTGTGDLPDNLVAFAAKLKDQMPLIPHKRYAVIALGDSSYGDTYCGAGKHMDELLAELQAVKLGQRLDIDACEVLEPEEKALPWTEHWITLL